MCSLDLFFHFLGCLSCSAGSPLNLEVVKRSFMRFVLQVFVCFALCLHCAVAYKIQFEYCHKTRASLGAIFS